MKPTLPLLVAVLAAALFVPVQAQDGPPPSGPNGGPHGGPHGGPPGGPRFGGGPHRGPGGPMRSKGRLMHLWHGIGELNDKNAISKTQAQRIVALMLPVAKKTTLSDEESTTLSDKLEAILTSSQKTALFLTAPDAPVGHRRVATALVAGLITKDVTPEETIAVGHRGVAWAGQMAKAPMGHRRAASEMAETDLTATDQAATDRAGHAASVPMGQAATTVEIVAAVIGIGETVPTATRCAPGCRNSIPSTPPRVTPNGKAGPRRCNRTWPVITTTIAPPWKASPSGPEAKSNAIISGVDVPGRVGDAGSKMLARKS